MEKRMITTDVTEEDFTLEEVFVPSPLTNTLVRKRPKIH